MISRQPYFGIKLDLPGRASKVLHYQDEKGEIYLGPHVRLAGTEGMAHIESAELAERYAEACAPHLKRRYGNETRLKIVEWSATSNKKLDSRIQNDSEIIKKRLSTANLAPNKPV